MIISLKWLERKYHASLLLHLRAYFPLTFLCKQEDIITVVNSDLLEDHHAAINAFVAGFTLWKEKD